MLIYQKSKLMPTILLYGLLQNLLLIKNLLLLFIFAGKQLVSGIMAGAVKG